MRNKSTTVAPWKSGGSAEEFLTPGFANAPAAYWFWHRIPTAEEVNQQIEEMQAAGYQSFQIQTRMSFPLEEYLSEPYLLRCRQAADKASKLGMKIGIYDEYNWLSGHAGGRVVSGHDELRERHLFHTTVATDAHGAVAQISGIHPQDVAYLLDSGMNWVFEGGVPQWDEWQIVAAIDTVTGEDLTENARIVEESPDGCRVVVDDVLGPQVTVVLGARCCTSRMINYLDRAAAQRFVEVGYQPYARAFGEHLGDTVRYVFYDQPHACFFTWDQNDGPTAATVMYDERFFTYLKQEFASEWAPTMLSLAICDVDDKMKALRARFFEKYSEQVTNAFFGTLQTWCHEHSLLLSGHEVLAHVSCWDPTGRIITDDPRSNFGVDYFLVDSYRDITGVDARNEYPQLPAKFGDSVARSNGRSGCIVEQYFGRVVPGAHFAAGWWELTLAQLRDQTIRHHILGARQILMHAYWLTDGYEGEEFFTNPRFDFAPGVNFEPWFKHHRQYAEESSRVSVFLDGMEPMGEVALLYPLRTAWAEGPDHDYGKHFAFWAENLARLGVDYQIIDERDLRAASVDQEILKLADGRQYRTLVLPHVTMLQDRQTVETLRQLGDAGGHVVSSGSVAEYLEYGDVSTTTIAELMQAPRWKAFAELPDWEEAAAQFVISRTMNLWVEDVTKGEGQLWSRRGQDERGTRVILFNDSSHSRVVRISPPHYRSYVTRWNHHSGLLDAVSQAEGNLQIELSAGEVVLLHVRGQGGEVPSDIALTVGWTFTIDGETSAINPSHGWEQQGYPSYSGNATYQCTFDLKALPNEADSPGWQLLLPGIEGTAEVSVNGRQIEQITRTPHAVTIAKTLVNEGENHLSIEVSSSAANFYYQGTHQQSNGLAPSGLTAIPILRPLLPLTRIEALREELGANA